MADVRYRSTRNQWQKLKPKVKEMRHAATSAEAALWEALRNRRLAGIKFRRQHAIGPYIVDFFAGKFGVAIEVDGPVHDQQVDRDKTRDAYLRSQGVDVVRFKNDDVLSRLSEVILEILTTCQGQNRGKP